MSRCERRLSLRTVPPEVASGSAETCKMNVSYLESICNRIATPNGSSFRASEPGDRFASDSGGRRRTEGDGKVEDEATPEHASDGLDCGGGHLGGNCWSCLGGCRLRTGIALVKASSRSDEVARRQGEARPASSVFRGSGWPASTLRNIESHSSMYQTLSSFCMHVIEFIVIIDGCKVRNNAVRKF